MLDIKCSDLDTLTTDLSKNRNNKLICDGLINSFSHLIHQRQNLYQDNIALKSIHNIIMSPENIKLDFYSSYDQKEINLTVLPIFQLSGQNWPSYSPYSCWNCDCQFDTPPIGSPEYVIDNQFYCSGNFCSFGCAGRFIIDNDHTINRFEKLSLLNRLYQIAFNLNITDYVQIADPKQILHKYGGCSSYAQYHNQNGRPKIEIYKLPIIPLYYYICKEEQQNDNLDDLKTNKKIISIK